MIRNELKKTISTSSELELLHACNTILHQYMFFFP